jgi:hypothetical protein
MNSSSIDNINASNISGTINSNISNTGDMDDIDLEDLKNNTVYNDSDDESVYSYTYGNQGWSDQARDQLLIFLSKLRYHRVINNFYLSTLKKSEATFGWNLILLSTITSALTVANNVEEEPIQHYHLTINILLNTVSFTTSLIGAYMKKKQFVERINNIDRYYQKLNTLCEGIEFELIKIVEDKMPYEAFKKKYYNKIKEYLVPNPLISPSEWKSTVKEITLNYPELIDPDDTDENRLWPWYSMKPGKGGEKTLTPYSDRILNKYKYIPTYKDKDKDKDSDNDNDNDYDNEP